VVSNPLKTKAIAEANVKTDKVDARVLADLLRCNYLPSVWVPTPDIEDKRAIAARRTALVHERTSIRNRIHSVLARRLVAAPEGDLFSGKGLTGSSTSSSPRSIAPWLTPTCVCSMRWNASP
jgi:transposase